jgi:hypothetical protein
MCSRCFLKVALSVSCCPFRVHCSALWSKGKPSVFITDEFVVRSRMYSQLLMLSSMEDVVDPGTRTCGLVRWSWLFGTNQIVLVCKDSCGATIPLGAFFACGLLRWRFLRK